MSDGNQKQTCEDGLLKDRLIALLTLASHVPANSVEHLSMEQMQALVNGVLDDSEREDVLAHINGCEQCRHDWLVLSNPRHQPLKESDNGAEDSGTAYRGKVVVLQHHKEKLGWIAAISLGLAASFLAVIFWPHSPISLLERLDGLYRLYHQEVRLDGELLAQQIPIPSDNLRTKGYGFTADGNSDPAIKAFNAGLWLAREDIRTGGSGPAKPLPAYLLPVNVEEKAISKDPWRHSDWAKYSSLGRWIVLLRIRCAMSGDRQQKLLIELQAIGLGLTQEFKKRTESYTHPILNVLKQLNQELDGLYTVNRVSEVCRGIEDETERLIVLLSS